MPQKQDVWELLWKLEGLHTVETVAETLRVKKQSALNLLSKLKKGGHVTTSGGGKQKRLYTITIRKQLPRSPGMFDLINKYSPMKINPWYDHQVHGRYTVEDALVDAIETKNFRIILAAMHLYKHITDWPRLHLLAKQRDCWQQVGALYDMTRLFLKVRKMPKRYDDGCFRRMQYLIQDYKTTWEILKPITKKWKVYIPLQKGDINKVTLG